MRPFEFTATASTSPRFMSAEYLRKPVSASKGISGTVTGGGAATAAAGDCSAAIGSPLDPNANPMISARTEDVAAQNHVIDASVSVSERGNNTISSAP